MSKTHKLSCELNTRDGFYYSDSVYMLFENVVMGYYPFYDKHPKGLVALRYNNEFEIVLPLDIVLNIVTKPNAHFEFDFEIETTTDEESTFCFFKLLNGGGSTLIFKNTFHKKKINRMRFGTNADSNGLLQILLHTYKNPKDSIGYNFISARVNEV